MHWALGAPCGLGEKGAFVLVGKRKAVWRGMASQGYEIRLFDKRIASFTFETNCFGESCAVGLRVEPGADALAAIRAALPKDTADDVYKIILTGESFAAPELEEFGAESQ